MSTATIFVRIQEPAFHYWESAPEETHEYLRHNHRHLFHIEARCLVRHDDREVEFHDLQAFLRGLWMLEIAPLQEAGPQSCEHLARKIANECARIYERQFLVTVSEDGECGAEVKSDDRDGR